MSTFDFDGNPVNVVKCSHSDIDRHYESIKHFTEGTCETAFRTKMLQAVDNGSAYCIDGTNCFIYYVKGIGIDVDGVALNGHTDTYKTLAMFHYVFGVQDKGVRFVRFHLHKNKVISEYRSLLDKASIRLSYADKTPLKVDVKSILHKLDSIYANKGVLCPT